MAFYDWNHNGKKNDAFDNFMDYQMVQNANHERKKRLYTMAAYQSGRQRSGGGGSGCGDGCGCLIAIIAVFVFLIILFFV